MYAENTEQARHFGIDRELYQYINKAMALI